jgi:hypothetical protein
MALNGLSLQKTFSMSDVPSKDVCHSFVCRIAQRLNHGVNLGAQSSAGQPDGFGIF